ncbi:AMP-binding protein [Microbulbifer yueqingensis]|uniref:Long-chain acyl-CoA synthetase n=1 Tax=Microbulbifer yueqingensis TaxID=658219 RepID=A0A1G8XBL4_9GAMM|nr:AMP-binding protein [Microbulbifer yueqingensis]SDJ87706.1 long-chain acyl-CoA synthetase [Microbulbifer yueqingensis]
MTPEEKYERLRDRQPLDILYQREREQPDRVYLRQMQDRRWREYTWGEVMDRARRIATFLGQRFARGDRIAIHAKNCADWIIVDIAIMLAGMVSVPLYPGQSAGSMRFVLGHAECRLLFCGASDDNDALREVAATLPSVAIQRCEIECDQSLEQLVSRCDPMSGCPLYDKDDVFTIMYTSGTTGKPKGVMHTWSAISFAVPNMVRGFGYDEHDRFFSYLPLAHAAERIVVEFHSLYAGTPVHFPESLDTFLEDLQRTRPTMFFSVPRLWAKFKEGIDARIPPRVQRTLLGIPGLAGWFRRKVQRGLGLDQARMLVTGASPISIDLQRWYHRMGMMVADGYGMTENFIYGCITHMGETPVPGTVGRPFWGCEVKVSAEGEILFRSRALMKGYYLEPEKTAEVLVDGFYRTGDAGYIDGEGLLHVTGRLADTFKTSKGKFIQPPELEGHFGDEPLLGQVCVLGHGLDQPVLLATLSEMAAGQDRGAVNAQLQRTLAAVNERLEHHERIASIYITEEEWSVRNDLLTPTLKIKRKALEERYRGWIEAHPGTGQVVWEREESARAPARSDNFRPAPGDTGRSA